MKQTILVLFVFLLIVLHPRPVSSWGFHAHEMIHRYAIRALPDSVRPFFERHAQELIDRSVEADKRRYSDKAEGFYHYIDIDRYGRYPFADLPRQYQAAARKFGKETVDTNGTVPWRIAEFTEKLAGAIAQNDTASMVFFAANLGHYVADAHVPLHVTENYDGQRSGQRGLHARWESRLPESFSDSYEFDIRQAVIIDDPLNHAFAIVLQSYQEVDSVLRADQKSLESIPEANRFIERKRNGKVIFEYSDEYFDRFHENLNGMVERRMEDAVHGVASYWLTAWAKAQK